LNDSNSNQRSRRFIQLEWRKDQIGVAILAVLMAVIAVAWLFPWVEWAARTAAYAADTPLMSPLLMLAIIASGALITRWAIYRSLTWKQLATIVTLSGLVALFVVAWVVFHDDTLLKYLRGLVTWTGFFSPQVIVVIATAMLWVRGIFIGRADILREDLESIFYTGILALIVLLVFDSTRPVVPLTEVFWSALIFFASSLLALALVGPEHAHFWQRESSSVRLMLNRYWLITAGALIGVLVLIGVVLTGSARVELLDALRSIVTAAIIGLAYVVQFIFAAIVQIIIWLLTPLVPLFERLGVALGQVLSRIRPPDQPPGDTSNTAALEAFLRSADVAAFTRGLVVLAIVMICLFVFMLVLIRLGFLPKRGSDETRESIASRALLLSQLKNFMARRNRRAVMAPPPYLPAEGDDPRQIVRRAYQAFLEWAISIGRARSPEQTPATYAAALAKARPEGRDSIVTLTDVYVRARYAVDPITPDDARAATDSLVSLQTANMLQSSSSDQS
jgi:hypothetical protein